MIKRSFLVSAVIVLGISAIFIIGCIPETATKTVITTTTATETIALLQTIEDISVTEAYAMIQENEDNSEFVVIDLRTPEERLKSYIEDSFSLDWNAGIFTDEVELLDRYNTYLLY